MLRPRRLRTSPLSRRHAPEALARRKSTLIIGEQPVDSARRGLRNLGVDLFPQLGDLRLEAEHFGMLRLHELALLLIIALELRKLLAKRDDAVVDVSIRPRPQGFAIGPLGTNPAGRGRPQSGVQLNERFALQRICVSAGLPSVLGRAEW